MKTRSTPTFDEFNPGLIPFQDQAMEAFHTIDYPALGMQEFLFSGTVGSSKSLFAAHLAIWMCITFPGCRGLIGRNRLSDLRDTLFQEIVDHLEGTTDADGRTFEQGVHWKANASSCRIRFCNGSEIIARSWNKGEKDNKGQKMGSLKITFAIIEEATENENDDEPVFDYIATRIGRQPHIPIQWLLFLCNPAGPSHFLYKRFQIGERQEGRTEGLNPNRHVFFSHLKDNPFLGEHYAKRLANIIDERLAQRLLHGKWVEIYTERVYHQYRAANFRETLYEVDEFLPVRLCFDFNIGVGKPMSVAVMQWEPRTDIPGGFFHTYSEVVIEGADTEEMMEELDGRGHLNHATIIVHGDANGKARTTKSKRTDYDIIRAYLDRYRRPDGTKIDFEIKVPAANPAIRDRQNVMNTACRSYAGTVRFFVYKTAPTVDEGMRLVQLRKGAQYEEDDKKRYQHIIAALGYGVYYVTNEQKLGSRIEEVAYR